MRDGKNAANYCSRNDKLQSTCRGNINHSTCWVDRTFFTRKYSFFYAYRAQKCLKPDEIYT